MHALSAKDNILYNGQIALDKGIVALKGTYKDNFWQILPIERMQVTEELDQPETAKNANFERAETKATKAIQKHSMNINGMERNSQMDEAYLLLGKTRYYDQRFVPALEAFNYILYKSPASDKIHEARIWREKTNMRLENDALALKNLKYILKDIRLKNQVFADANATISQAFINVGKKDSAIASLKLATEFTKFKEATVVNSVLPKLEANSQNKMSIPDPQATILKV
jgi:tetratricopeptide (TPR) repeat protein